MRIFDKKETSFREMINEVATRDSYIYLTVACDTRTKRTAAKAKGLMLIGNFAEALRIADPIGYNVGLNEFKRENCRS